MQQLPPGCRWVGRAVGVDLHRDFCELAICEDGVVRSAGRVKTTPEALEVLGASFERILEPHVQRVVVVSPDDTGIAQARTKTDKRDARALAKLLWQGELDAVWMPDKRCRVLRRRLSRRAIGPAARGKEQRRRIAKPARRPAARPPGSSATCRPPSSVAACG